jgi:hypothetical protein
MIECLSIAAGQQLGHELGRHESAVSVSIEGWTNMPSIVVIDRVYSQGSIEYKEILRISTSASWGHEIGCGICLSEKDGEAFWFLNVAELCRGLYCKRAATGLIR